MIEITKVVNPPPLGKMYRYQDTVYSTGDDEYGFHTRAAVNVYTFDIVKETPKGQWIQDEFHGIKPRFVLNSGRKRYAHKTKEEALLAFKARKKKQIKILEAQLEHVKEALFCIGYKEEIK